MKKIIPLSLSLIFIISACGKDNKSKGDTTNDQLLARIGELEKQNSELKKENEILKVNNKNKQKEVIDTQEKETEETNIKEEEIKSDNEDEQIPRQNKNALKAAENYITTMPFSKDALYEQLTSEHGSKFPQEAAQYAIDNLKVDYKEQALKAAQNYLNTMPMSDDELYQQLTSEYGDKYTQEEAQYAIDNID